jgi:ATP-binding cassette subfamily B protein
MKPVEKDRSNLTTPQTLETLAFNWVTFGYSADSTTIKNISFDANTWETIAFVWPSGAGKSTIVKLLLGLYQPLSGEIKINNTNIEQIDDNRYKWHIGYVAQDTQLFSGTIRENLIFVKPDATIDDIQFVLRAAQLWDFIIQQPQWIETKIWEWWLKLSWGQKQRLAIARSLLRNPNILIFDEATSSLDSMVEAEITDTIKTITSWEKNCISIMIAHRLSTIMHADKIYVVEKGEIVESWKHDALVAQKWLYYALWRQQSWGN